jgi:hypothetical protein
MMVGCLKQVPAQRGETLRHEDTKTKQPVSLFLCLCVFLVTQRKGLEFLGDFLCASLCSLCTSPDFVDTELRLV